MSQTPELTADLDRLRDAIEHLDGVQRVFLDQDAPALYLVCDAEGDADAMELDARSRLTGAGIGADAVGLHVSKVAPTHPRRRVRFLEGRAEEDQRAITATVALEWGGETVRRTAEGERGGVADIRLPAVATLRCLESILSDRVRLELVGVKSVRAFDSDLVAVLVQADDDREMVGAVLAGHRSRAEASVLAVLSALNRLLGNYLHASD